MSTPLRSSTVVIAVLFFIATSATGCAPQRAALDPRAHDALALLQDTSRSAEAVNADAVVIGYARGQAVKATGEIDGSHDIFRVDVEVDGKPARLFGRLDAKKTTLRMVAIIAEPPVDPAAAPASAALTHYSNAWNVDANGRDAELEQGFAAEGEYIDPQISLRGRPALAKHIAAFHESLPLGNIEPRSGTLQVANGARFRWTTRLGAIGVVDGEDLVLFDDDGRIALVCGYWD